jgi:RND family efflux transporter MFP subunit
VLKAQNALDKILQPADSASLASAQDNLKLRQQSLDELKAGASEIEIKQAQNSVAQRQSALTAARNNLADAQKNLAKYTIRAAFDGVVTGLKVKAADTASQGTVLLTLVTDKTIATLTLNETDAAKVAIGQKATVTFDAIDGLSITGEVAQLDVQGTISQGVASFGLKIAFDTQDERVRPGMTANAQIIIKTIPDALTLPNAAIKNLGDQSYVLVVDNPPQNASGVSGIALPTPPREQTVGVGDSNDSVTVITSGLTGDENVVVRTITATSAQTSSANSALGGVRIPGVTGGAAIRGN